jgi:hypothetical protein
VNRVDGEPARLVGSFGKKVCLQRHGKNPFRRSDRGTCGKERISISPSDRQPSGRVGRLKFGPQKKASPRGPAFAN